MFDRSPDSALPALITAQRAETRPSPGPLEEQIVSLFEQCRTPLLRYVSGFGLELSDGEEIIQETFLALYQHLRAGKPQDNLRAWLFRVAHNLALKRYARIRRDSANPIDLTMPGDPAPTVEDRLIENETRQALRAVVRALPELDRRCLALRAEGFQYREIAQILNISLGAVSLSLTRSIARLARAAER